MVPTRDRRAEEFVRPSRWRMTVRIMVCLFWCSLVVGCSSCSKKDPSEAERKILDERGRGHTMVFPENSAQEITYFDPSYVKDQQGVVHVAAAQDKSERGVQSHPIPQECTSFCLDNNGFAVFGSNYDYPQDNSEGLVFVNRRNISKSFPGSDPFSKHVSWTSRYGSVTFNLVMSQAAFAGMNEAGLVISVMGLRESRPPKPDKRPWIHTGLWLQYVLDNHSTIEEVMASQSSVRIVGSPPPYFVPHYLVSDKYGNCAVIEFLKGIMVVHSGRDLPVKVLANMTYEQSISEWRRISELRKNGGSIPEMSPSMRRFSLAADRVSSFRPQVTCSVFDEAFDILEDVSGQKIKGSPTLWSLVFDAKNLVIHFKTILHAERRTLNVQGLDFSCQSPTRMIDINEKLAGDITDRLKAYSSSLHVGHALRASKRWRIRMGADEVKELIRLIEAFPCADNSQSK